MSFVCICAKEGEFMELKNVIIILLADSYWSDYLERFKRIRFSADFVEQIKSESGSLLGITRINEEWWGVKRIEVVNWLPKNVTYIVILHELAHLIEWMDYHKEPELSRISETGELDGHNPNWSAIFRDLIDCVWDRGIIDEWELFDEYQELMKLGYIPYDMKMVCDYLQIPDFGSRNYYSVDIEYMYKEMENIVLPEDDYGDTDIDENYY